MDLYGSQLITLIPAAFKLFSAFFKARVIGGCGWTILTNHLAMPILRGEVNLPIIPHDTNCYVFRALNVLPWQWYEVDFGIPWLLVEYRLHQ